MDRRHALSLLAAAALPAAGRTESSLARYFGSSLGSAILIDVANRSVIATHRPKIAAAQLLPPGSTLKPIVLASLLRVGKLNADESFACPGELTLNGRSYACSHPAIVTPMRVRTALAYSCNCFVARCARRFEPGDLTRQLESAALVARTGWFGPSEVAGQVRPATTVEATQMQALGERGILVTVAGLANAYLSLSKNPPGSVLEGLEDAVEFGTAQQAAVPALRVAAKTGSVRSADGAHIAWLAAFAPSRSPEVVLTVMVQGRSGGADAAPIAREILSAYRSRRL